MSPAPPSRLGCMSPIVRSQISMSLDGFVAGPDQTQEEPLGRNGEALHDWMFQSEHDADVRLRERMQDRTGAYVMGRNMFGPARDSAVAASEWRGWWGEDPPFHAPVYVLTHEPREPVQMEGGTTFHFVTDGLEAALALAREAAGPHLDVQIAGGASVVNQALRAGALDELHVHIVPLLLGGGARLFDGVGTPALEVVETIASPAATHVRYRVAR
jgi:dihydrofolate reductase